MKATNQNQNLVGRKVLIDWPIRWSADAGYVGADVQAEFKARASKNEHWFGQTAEIVAYNPNDDEGKVLTLVLDKSGEIVRVMAGAVTITGPAPAGNADIVKLLQAILVAINTHAALRDTSLFETSDPSADA